MSVRQSSRRKFREWKGLEDMIRGNQALGINTIQKFSTKIAYKIFQRILVESQQLPTIPCLSSFASPSAQNFIFLVPMFFRLNLWKTFFKTEIFSALGNWWTFDSRTETIFVLKWESTSPINYNNELHLESTIQLPPTQINTFCSETSASVLYCWEILRQLNEFFESFTFSTN